MPTLRLHIPDTSRSRKTSNRLQRSKRTARIRIQKNPRQNGTWLRRRITPNFNPFNAGINRLTEPTTFRDFPQNRLVKCSLYLKPN